MTNKKENMKFINDIYKNAHIALQSISNVRPHATGEQLINELLAEYEGYEKIIGEIASFMRENNFMPKDINVFKKAMLSASINMNAWKDDSDGHLAEMMVQGTVMGITELKQMQNDFTPDTDASIIDFAKKLCSIEEEYEEKLKKLI